MSKPKKIAQYTLEGEFIQCFDSASKAVSCLGRKQGSTTCIIKACKFTHTFAFGYRWLYAEDMPHAKELFEQRPVYKFFQPHGQQHTFQEIFELASVCKTKRKFKNKYPKLYRYAYSKGWIKQLGFEVDAYLYDGGKYTVYAIPFYKSNTVYVGLTNNMKRRWKEHNDLDAEDISGALKYSIETGIPMPEYPLIIEENLSAIEGQYFEGFWEKWYRSRGMNVLNKCKTGIGSGSLGAAKKIKSTEIIEAAKTCKTLKEFRTKHPNLLALAVNRNIVDELGLTKREKEKTGTYTEEYCYNLAKKYKTTKDFRADNDMVYLTTQQNGWLKQYWWLYDDRRKPVIKTKGFTIKLYKSLISCCSETGLAYKSFGDCLKGKKLYNGSYYHYLDINDIEFDIPDFEHRYII